MANRALSLCVVGDIAAGGEQHAGDSPGTSHRHLAEKTVYRGQDPCGINPGFPHAVIHRVGLHREIDSRALAGAEGEDHGPDDQSQNVGARHHHNPHPEQIDRAGHQIDMTFFMRRASSGTVRVPSRGTKVEIPAITAVSSVFPT